MLLPKLSPSVSRIARWAPAREFSNIRPLGWQPLGNYGNWCGYNNTRDDPNYPAWDEVDAVCRDHDNCINNNGGGFHGHLCACDHNFNVGMANALASPRLNAQARSYAAAALEVFQRKPCFCEAMIQGNRVRVPGIAGSCSGGFPFNLAPFIPPFSGLPPTSFSPTLTTLPPVNIPRPPLPPVNIPRPPLPPVNIPRPPLPPVNIPRPSIHWPHF